VVWFHDFVTNSEVDQFRWTGGYGNDPSSIAPNSANCRRNASDHPTGTGGCLEINIPTGGQAGSNWWRPLSALAAGTSGNGRGVPDPADANSLPIRTYNASSPSMYERFSTGYYGHPDYQAAYPTWPHPSVSSVANNYTGPQSNVWDGDEFFVQFRVKMTSGRSNPLNPGGKLLFISNTYRSNPANEIVLRSSPDYRFDMYTNNGGSDANAFLTDLQGQAGNPSYLQPGYSQANCRIFNNTVDRSGCWSFAPNVWHTVLMKIKPGLVGNPGWSNAETIDTLSPRLASQIGGANANTGITVWVARQGESTYTKIWDKQDYVFAYGVNGNPHPPAFNALICSGFMNAATAGSNAVEGWQHRYAQIICSKQFIACPRV